MLTMNIFNIKFKNSRVCVYTVTIFFSGVCQSVCTFETALAPRRQEPDILSVCLMGKGSGVNHLGNKDDCVWPPWGDFALLA